MKNLLSRILFIVALVLSHFACILVTYKYVNHVCAINFEGASAAKWVPLLWLFLFIPLILVVLFFAIKYGEKAKLEKEVSNSPEKVEDN